MRLKEIKTRWEKKKHKKCALATIFVRKTGLSWICQIDPKAAKFFEFGSLWQSYSFTKTEANAVVHVIKKIGLEAVESHPKPLRKTIQVKFFAGAEKFLRKRELLKVGSKSSEGFQARGQWIESAGHLDAPDFFPRGGLVEDGCSGLTACQGLLDVP
jgi:hypothetical protein